jgi:hypothetical protein
MTFQDFLSVLRQQRDKFTWELEGNAIVAHHPSAPFKLCPLGVVAAGVLGLARKVTQPMLAGEELGLKFKDIHQIMVAASIPTHLLRDALVDACGLMC